MTIDKRGGRAWNKHRPIDISVGFHRLAEGSVLYRTGGTVVLITASIEESVPRFLEGSGKGWITAEYQMHPRANPQRRESRDGRNRPLSGRTREIERLVGRSLRAAADLKRLGERSIHVDCDVLEADGGTRTACVSGGWVALALAVERLRERGLLAKPPLVDQVAAISAGHVDGKLALDLCYAEDSMARVDLNAVGTAQGDIVEIQGTAEGRALPRNEMDALIDLALDGVRAITEIQKQTLENAGVRLSGILAT